MKLTAKTVKEYQAKKEQIETIGEFKALGRELKDKYNLTDREAIDILNSKNDEVIKMLASTESRG